MYVLIFYLYFKHSIRYIMDNMDASAMAYLKLKAKYFGAFILKIIILINHQISTA